MRAVMRAALHFLRETKLTLTALTLVGLLATGIWFAPEQLGHAAMLSKPARNAATATAVPPTPTIPPDPLAPPAAAGAWQPIFVESFNGTVLDATHWNTCFWWSSNAPNGCEGSAQNGELEYYLPENITVRGGALDIVARRDHVTTDTGAYDYTSGLITTDGKFTFRYGYVEARIRVTEGRGVWPAVWMLPADHSSTNEVDIAEILGDQPQVLNMAVHFMVGASHRSVGAIDTAGDFATGYHVVAVDWEPQSITWYEDGKVVYRVTDPGQISHKDMYLILNSAVGGPWAGNPNSATPFPNQFQVDWVQVWSKGGSAQTPSAP